MTTRPTAAMRARIEALSDRLGRDPADVSADALEAGLSALERLERDDVRNDPVAGSKIPTTPAAVADLLNLGLRVVIRPADETGPFLFVQPLARDGIGTPWTGLPPDSGGVAVTLWSAPHPTGKVLASGAVRPGEPYPAGLLAAGLAYHDFDAAMTRALASEAELRAAASPSARSRRIPLRRKPTSQNRV